MFERVQDTLFRQSKRVGVQVVWKLRQFQRQPVVYLFNVNLLLHIYITTITHYMSSEHATQTPNTLYIKTLWR